MRRSVEGFDQPLRSGAVNWSVMARHQSGLMLQKPISREDLATFVKSSINK